MRITTNGFIVAKINRSSDKFNLHNDPRDNLNKFCYVLCTVEASEVTCVGFRI